MAKELEARLPIHAENLASSAIGLSEEAWNDISSDLLQASAELQRYREFAAQVACGKGETRGSIAMTEREAIVAWHEDKALSLPKLDGIRGFLWAFIHPRQFAELKATFWAHVEAAKAIERGDHLNKDRDAE